MKVYAVTLESKGLLGESTTLYWDFTARKFRAFDDRCGRQVTFSAVFADEVVQINPGSKMTSYKLVPAD